MNAESKSSVRVKILDLEYSVTGYSDPDYLQQVAALVDQHMRMLRQMHSDISPQKIAILTALNLADELMRIQRQLDQYHDEAQQFNREISERARKLADLCPPS